MNNFPILATSQFPPVIWQQMNKAPSGISNFFKSLFSSPSRKTIQAGTTKGSLHVEAKKLILELKQNEDKTPTELKLSELAKKITETVLPIIQTIESSAQNPLLSDETILAAHGLAEILLSSKPLQKGIWKNLCPVVQQLFHVLAPVFSPPPKEGEKSVPFDLVKAYPTGDFQLGFSDGRLFRASFAGKDIGFAAFDLPSHPGLVLSGISKAPFQLLDMVNAYLDFQPPGMSQVFDLDSIERELEAVGPNLNAKRELAKKTNHKRVVLKSEYMRMLLGSLGLAVDRPLFISKTGEWTIQASGQAEALSGTDFQEWGNEKIDKIAGQIRNFFEFERKFGIALFGDDKTAPSVKTLFLIKDQSEVYLRTPLKTLSFIKENMEERHNRLQEVLAQSLPCKLVTAIFALPFTEILLHENAPKVFQSMILNGCLDRDEIFTCSDLALEIFRSLIKNRYLLENPETIPWERIPGGDFLITYLHLCELIEDPKIEEIPTEAIADCIFEILINIPSGLNPHESQSAFLQKLPEIVEKDGLLRRKLQQLAFKKLLAEYLANPEASLEEKLNSIIEKTNAALEKKCSLAKLSIPVLLEQKVNKGGSVEYIFEKDPAPVTAYVIGAVWNDLVEKANEILFRESAPPSIQEKIALLRCLDNKSDKSSDTALTGKLFEVVHDTMLTEENKKLLSQLRERIQVLYPT